MSDLTFRRINQGNGHRYEFGLWQDVNGRRRWMRDHKIPGVTTIINAGLPKPGLVNWAAGSVADAVVDHLRLADGHVIADDLIDYLRSGAKYPIPEGLPRVKLATELRYVHNRDRDAGANKGGKVHDLAHQLAQTGQADIPDELLGYVDAYLDWTKRWQPINELAERPLLNREAFYAGTFDLWAELVGPTGLCRVCFVEGCQGRCLIDWKTGRSGIYGSTCIQLAAYRNGQTYIDTDGDEHPMPPIDHCLGVWLRADRSHETYELRADPTEYRLFRYVYELAKFLEGPELFGLDGDAPERTAKSEPLVPLTEAAAS
jgi:hypothetical protein